MDEPTRDAAEPARVADVTLALRLPANHPVITEDYLFAEVTVGGHQFTLEREAPLRPVAERQFGADYCGYVDDEADYDPADQATPADASPQAAEPAAPAAPAAPASINFPQSQNEAYRAVLAATRRYLAADNLSDGARSPLYRRTNQGGFGAERTDQQTAWLNRAVEEIRVRLFGALDWIERDLSSPAIPPGGKAQPADTVTPRVQLSPTD